MTQERPTMAQRGDASYTWDDTIAAIGKDLSRGRERLAQETIEYTSVSRYCEVWEIGNPLYWYEDVAKLAGYKGVLAAWSSLTQTFTNDNFWRPGQFTHFPSNLNINAGAANPAPPEEQDDPLPKPPTTNSVRTDMEIEYFEPVCVGDRLTVKGNKVVNVRPRETRIGVGAFVNWAIEVYNQRRELVVRFIRGSYMYNPK